MTTISAAIVADSLSPEGQRLTTMELVYPRFIHAEFMTHRQFSRNASSSRAIPVERLIADIEQDPAVPLFWGKNQKGMQAGEELGAKDREYAEQEWRSSLKMSVAAARNAADHGLHKQIVNRLLEPFAHIRVLVTATEWANFFALRLHSDAEPHIQLLAQRMAAAMETSSPVLRAYDSWHLPYVTPEDYASLTSDELRAVSVARCARVSYKTHDNRVPKIDEDLALYRRLVESQPLHASPAEHQARPDEPMIGDDRGVLAWKHASQHGNFVGWRQYRKFLEQHGAFS